MESRRDGANNDQEAITMKANNRIERHSAVKQLVVKRISHRSIRSPASLGVSDLGERKSRLNVSSLLFHASCALHKYIKRSEWKPNPRYMCVARALFPICNENEKYRKSLQCDVYRYARVLSLNETKRRSPSPTTIFTIIT